MAYSPSPDTRKRRNGSPEDRGRSKESRRRRSRSRSNERERSRRHDDQRKRSRSRSNECERSRHHDDRRKYDKERSHGDRKKEKERNSRSRDIVKEERNDPPAPSNSSKTKVEATEERIPWNEFPPPKVKQEPLDPTMEQPKLEEEPIEKEKPSLKPSGKLLEDTNMVNGVVVKYVEPPEAKLPKVNWQLHPFRNQEGKDPEPLPVMHIHRRSFFLVGRDRKVVHFPMDHPSCSKQHAALQFRSLPYTKPTGERSRRTKPYLIDLESANGTYLNDDRIEATRYYELKHGDEIKFGFSSRSFVILNATAAMAQMDDVSNVKKEEESDDEEEEETMKEEASTKEEKFE